MPGLIGKKVGMTSIYGASGKNIPCTVLEVGPCVVTQVRTLEKDGYSAVQLGFGSRSEKNTSKAMLGHFKKAGVDPQRHLVEFKNFNDELIDAQELAEFAKITPCKINIIEYNPIDDGEFQQAKREKVDAFVNYLESKNLIVNVRRSRGKDIDAACGQLANKLVKS